MNLSVLHIDTKIHMLILYLVPAFKVLKKQVYSSVSLFFLFPLLIDFL